MKREGWRLNETEWREWLEALLQSGKRLVAPVEDDGISLFRSISSADDISLAEYGNTRWSPKEFLFPRTEGLFSYRFQGDRVMLEDPDRGDGGQVLFGLRPCDAAGLTRLGNIFLGEIEDPFYANRKRNTIIVSLACESARPECFCTAVGGSPAGTDGSDLQLVQIQDKWLLQALTPEGERLIGPSAAGWTAASDEDWAAAAEQRLGVEQEIKRNPIPAEWAATLEGTFENPVWEAIGQRCLGCGICAYVCPSCSCFDVNDQGNAYCGVRCRSWDSCSFSEFTSHASGHNPRPNQRASFRQRVLHKFAYFPLQHQERLMCVGCGRCLRSCPVGIDIHQSVERAVAAGTSEEVRP